MKVSEALKNVQSLGVDTSPYIYYVESHQTYVEKMDAIFKIIEVEIIKISTSTITLTEALTKPIKTDDLALINMYRELLTNTDAIQMVSITPAIADKGAQLRAKYNLRTPDALHVATAIESGCEAFLTNDLGIKRVTELRILILDELELDT